MIIQDVGSVEFYLVQTVFSNHYIRMVTPLYRNILVIWM